MKPTAPERSTSSPYSEACRLDTSTIWQTSRRRAACGRSRTRSCPAAARRARARRAAADQPPRPPRHRPRLHPRRRTPRPPAASGPRRGTVDGHRRSTRSGSCVHRGSAALRDQRANPGFRALRSRVNPETDGPRCHSAKRASGRLMERGCVPHDAVLRVLRHTTQSRTRSRLTQRSVRTTRSATESRARSVSSSEQIS